MALAGMQIQNIQIFTLAAISQFYNQMALRVHKIVEIPNLTCTKLCFLINNLMFLSNKLKNVFAK